MTIHQALSNAVTQLSSHSDSPQLDAEILLTHLTHQPRSYFYTHPDASLTEAQLTEYEKLITRRMKGEPVAYITGTRAFWTFELDVTPDVLIPRPETELLVETVLSLVTTDAPVKVADLGTGSGAIALAIAYERPSWEVYATDVSESALSIANNNAQQLGFENVSFFPGYWCTALPCMEFDVIVSNPPYIAEKEWQDYAHGLEHEPRQALLSGEDGLDAIREIAETAVQYLKPGGYLLVEHGYMQGAAVRHLFLEAGLVGVKTLNDVSGNERATLGNKPF